VGETRVDLQHLLEDLRDAYTGSLEETIVIEIVANSLDAGASNIAISVNAAAPAITIVDDGRGMQRRELSRYHDIAASSKRRGEGIGFAGVGIKLGLLVSREVLTETRRGATHVATSWSLASRYRAPWKWVPAPGLLLARGTAVRLTLTSPLSPLLDVGFIEEAIRRHFEPLMHPVFDEMIRRHYAHAVSIDLDGRRLRPSPTDIGDIVPIAIRLARKRTPSAVGYLARLPAALQEDRSGIALSTFGKVIKRGWDWLGISPAAADRVTGLVEVPALAESLTLNKNDFIRTGARGATYLAYRKALQEAVLRQLTAWGESPPDPVMPRQSRLDRDLERVLEDLAGEFPLLHSLVERRRGGQKRLPISDNRAGDALASLTSLLTSREASQPDMDSSRDETEAPPDAATPSTASDVLAPQLPAPSTDEAAALPESGATRRRTQYGLNIRFEARPDDLELGRLVDNMIWVNERHPAYERALASRSQGYHLALSVALALAPLAVTPADEHRFVTRFLAEWGTVSGGRRRHNKRRPGSPRRLVRR
jgi:hypothetical protein